MCLRIRKLGNRLFQLHLRIKDPTISLVLTLTLLQASGKDHLPICEQAVSRISDRLKTVNMVVLRQKFRDVVFEKVWGVRIEKVQADTRLLRNRAETSTRTFKCLFEDPFLFIAIIPRSWLKVIDKQVLIITENIHLIIHHYRSIIKLQIAFLRKINNLSKFSR